jgi:hypothetical protein
MMQKDAEPCQFHANLDLDFHGDADPDHDLRLKVTKYHLEYFTGLKTALVPIIRYYGITPVLKSSSSIDGDFWNSDSYVFFLLKHNTVQDPDPAFTSMQSRILPLSLKQNYFFY